MYFPLLRGLLLATTLLTCVACGTSPFTISQNPNAARIPGRTSSQALTPSLTPANSQTSNTASWARQTLARAVSGLLAQHLAIEATALPLHDLLDGLAEQLSIDWQSAEPLDMLVSWNLPEQPAHAVLDQLAERFNLAWEVIGGVLQVKGPKPFTAFYSVDYLNLEREFSSSVGLATEVGTMRGVDESAGVGSENSSSTTINNLSKQQFWQSLAADLDLWLTDEAVDVRWAINRDTGLISLRAPPITHRQLVKYLEKVALNSHRQVLIEASVVEVLLSDEFETGIDWQLLAGSLDGLSVVQQLSGLGPLNALTADRVPTPSGLISFSQSTEQGDFSATFQLLEQFGEARIVSRPQILALNNQPAVLKVVDNRVYFTVNVERQQFADSSERLTETQIHTVPVGLVMNVTPHIGADGIVMLNVRPSLSRILGFVDDPNPDLNNANVTNGVPEIQVREMESVLRIPSGSIAVIGGLMQSVQDDRNRQLPGLANLPGIGGLFGQRKRERRRTELFIVIKATVVDSQSADSAVRRLL